MKRDKGPGIGGREQRTVRREQELRNGGAEQVFVPRIEKETNTPHIWCMFRAFFRKQGVYVGVGNRF
jgi:hypothetical protein